MKLSRGVVKKIQRAKDSQQRDAVVAPAKRVAKLPRALQRSEHDEQVALFQWAAMMPESSLLSLMFAIPNGGQRHVVVAKKLKAEGVKSGVPDICLPVARGGYHGCYVEMKRVGSTRSDTTFGQMAWIESLIEQGYYVIVAPGFEYARDAILKYLNLKAP